MGDIDGAEKGLKTIESFASHFLDFLILGNDFFLIEFGNFLDVRGIFAFAEVFEPFEENILFARNQSIDHQ